MQLRLTTFPMRPTPWHPSLLQTYGEIGLRPLYRSAAITVVYHNTALIPREGSPADGIVDQLGADLTASESSADSSSPVQTPTDSPAPLPSFSIALPVDVEFGPPFHVPDISISVQKSQLVEDAKVARAYVDLATDSCTSDPSSLAVAPSDSPASHISIAPALNSMWLGLPFPSLRLRNFVDNINYNEPNEVRVADVHMVPVAAEGVRLSVLSDRIASYIPIERLGKGAFGSVFVCLARPFRSGNGLPSVVAIKALSKQRMIESSDYFYSVKAEFDNAFEAASAGPFVAQIMSSFYDDDHVYFVMRHYAADLWSLLGFENYSKGMPIDDCKHYAAELVGLIVSRVAPLSYCSALQFLAIEQTHKMHITHGDIKPLNILVTPNGHLALADFGHSVATPEELREDPMSIVSTFRVGTPGYFAPEVVDPNSKGWNRQIDLWAAGCVLLQMILGRTTRILMHHIADSNATHLMYQLWDVERSLQVVKDPEARDLLMKLLDKNPETRITLENVKTHPFFRNLDWEMMQRREWTPPIYYGHRELQYGTPAMPLAPHRDNGPVYAEEDWHTFDWVCAADQLRDPVHGEMELDLKIKPREPLFPPGLPRPCDACYLSV
ncbi:hypothetical protein EWM64_g2195 [Hericium alpestre]|uniref:non-specific serine/threonine protein kinase n=1 Tax=Hericium alpestre TaxID=135208 RepID=A0A4Z0A470_9AGAM|nr:hypothetical protein EWM64_g2195 [Hericium alpestre]